VHKPEEQEVIFLHLYNLGWHHTILRAYSRVRQSVCHNITTLKYYFIWSQPTATMILPCSPLLFKLPLCFPTASYLQTSTLAWKYQAKWIGLQSHPVQVTIFSKCQYLLKVLLIQTQWHLSGPKWRLKLIKFSHIAVACVLEGTGEMGWGCQVLHAG